MQAAYFDYAPTARWYRHYSHSLHRLKLKQIGSASLKRIDHSEPQTRKLLPNLKRDIRDVHKEKQEVIQQQNLQILNRLNHVVSSSPSSTFKDYSTLKSPLSLNYPSRKMEAQRIAEENELLVKRLNKVQSSFNNKEFEKEYRRANKYKKNTFKDAD